MAESGRFFENLLSFHTQMQARNRNEDGIDRAEYLILMGNEHLRTINVLTNRILSELVVHNEIQVSSGSIAGNYNVELQSLYDDLISIHQCCF